MKEEIKLGRRVVITRSYSDNYPQHIGRTGVLVGNDKSSNPYKVLTDNKHIWCKDVRLETSTINDSSSSISNKPQIGDRVRIVVSYHNNHPNDVGNVGILKKTDDSSNPYFIVYDSPINNEKHTWCAEIEFAESPVNSTMDLMSIDIEDEYKISDFIAEQPKALI